jgi:hypothetical protein
VKAKQILVLILKIITLTILYFICFALASALVFPSPGAPPASAEQASITLVALLAVCFLNTMVLTYIILRSRWAGWRLIITMFLISYGTTTVMGQIETAVFVTRLPAGMLPRIFLMGGIVAGLFSPLAVIILGKRKRDSAFEEANSRLVMPASEWIWKAALIAIAYLVLYFTFGYFIAWRSLAVREYYGGTDSGSFVDQMRSMMLATPWLPFFQILRAMMWMAIALPVIRMTKGQWWEAGLAVGLLFAIVMNSQLLLPNPFMPEAVRMAHLVETASSNFLFGWLIVWLLLHRDKTSPRNLSHS